MGGLPIYSSAVKTKHLIITMLLGAVLLVALIVLWDAGRKPRYAQIAPGVEFSRYVVSPFRYRVFARAHVLRVDISVASLGLVSPGNGRFPVREMVRKAGALGGVNGQFFDENDTVLGLQVSGGKQLSAYRKTDGGVFIIDASGAALVHSLKFNPGRKVDFAVQCRPRLVVDGKPMKLKAQSARRTAIGVDEKGRVILAVTSGQPFRADNFARLLASLPSEGGLGCRDALNLDGGGSSQMYLDSRCDVPGSDTVANAVVVFPGKK